MLRSLYARLALGLIVLLATVGIIYGVASNLSLRAYYTSVDQELHRNLARNLVLDRNLVRGGQLDQAALKQLFGLYMTINPSIEIYLLDTQGQILSYSAEANRIKRESVDLAPVQTLLEHPERFPVLGDDPRSHDRRKAFSVTAIPASGTPEYYLYVVLRGEEFDAADEMARNSRLADLGLWAVAVSLGFGLVAGLLLFRMLTRRLSSLTRRVENFQRFRHAPADGGVQSQSNHSTGKDETDEKAEKDEIDTLDAAFSRMAERIERQVDELRDKDSQRRNLVAQVSHDLRTPLASVQGYLETLRLKGDQLDAGQQAQFLDIALTEARRLGRLVDELFELAALEAKEKPPVAEPFSMLELLHDVVMKHSPEANRRGVHLNIDSDRIISTVEADAGLTERVLDNLIRNALDYAPKGSDIRLAASMRSTKRGNEIEIQIADKGPGIVAEDLERIFDPLYRSAGEADSGHAGLGLAIARRIMTLQGGTVAAANNPDGGACFTITLPAEK